MKTTLMMLSLLLPLPAFAQTMYKCPSPTPGAPPIYQQMPCSPQGGGESMPVKAIPSGVDSSEATARMKAYSDKLNEEWGKQKKADHSNPSLNNHIEKIRKEELAKDCYEMEKRIHWIKKKEKEGSHLDQDSMMDDDSRDAIEEYESRCGSWRG